MQSWLNINSKAMLEFLPFLHISIVLLQLYIIVLYSWKSLFVPSRERSISVRKPLQIIIENFTEKFPPVQNSSCLSSEDIPNIFVNHKGYCMLRKAGHLSLFWTIKLSLPSSQTTSVRPTLITFFYWSQLSESDLIWIWQFCT